MLKSTNSYKMETTAWAAKSDFIALANASQIPYTSFKLEIEPQLYIRILY